MTTGNQSIPPLSQTAGRASPWWCTAGFIAVVAAALVLLLVAIESIPALAITLMDGGAALITLASAGLAGGWIVQWLGLGDRPWTERLILGSALGIGGLSLLTLGIGSAGLLTRPAAFALVLVLAVAGLARLILDQHPQRPPPDQTSPPSLRWLWMVICPFAVIAILAACLPPGVLWEGEEAHGYDVLEYHLAVPKEFWLQGHVGFLPENVYSNFPLNSEMLSLLMMTLRGDPIEASFMAQMANVVLAGLFVAASWLAGSVFSRRAGLVAGVFAATAPWTAYLAGIAYVEIGMLAMGMAGVAAVLRSAGDPSRLRRWALPAGLLAGLSIGFKYTALPFIAVPTAILILVARPSWRNRLSGLLVFSLGTAITICPWLVRNVINTHNPVFPLAYSVFGAKPGLWDNTLEARWQKAHGQAGVAEADLPVIVRLFGRTVGDFRMGGIVLILAIVGAIRRRDRWTVALLVVFIWQALSWLTATHQYARFAVVMLLPLILLVGRSFEIRVPLNAAIAIWSVFFLGTAWNLYRLTAVYYHHTRVEIVGTNAGGQPVEAYGRTDWFVSGMAPLSTINALGRQAKIMLVGEARTFYIVPPCEYATVFNHHPLAQAVRREPDARAVLQWLSRRGTRYIFVNWDEVKRLRATYGFYPEINEELFEQLVRAGLEKIDSFSIGENQPPYAALYEVPQK